MTGTARGPGPAGHDRILSLGTRVLSYTVWGDPGGEPVMLVHGLNTERHLWTPIARQLASRYLVVCPDLRGHGDSSWAPDGYHLAGFVADLHTLAAHLGIFPFHYVGHSLGARVGIAYAGELSPTLRTLTLSDSGPEVSRAGALAVRDRQAKIGAKRAFRDEAEALEFIRSLQPSWQPAFHELYVRHQLRLNWAGRLVQKADPDLIWITGAVSLRDVPYLWDMMSRIEVPTLVMWGRTSELMDSDLVARMLAAAPHAEARMFDTGHYIPKCACPERPVVTFTGDAGLWYHIGDLETAVRCGIGTVTVVNNNRSGNQSKRGFDRVYGGQQTDLAREMWMFTEVDFARLAESIGATGIRVERPEALGPALRRAFDTPGPVVIDVVTDVDAIAPDPVG